MLKYKTSQKTVDIDTITNQISNASKMKVDINPEYQRDIIWEEHRMEYFIDSIMRGIAPMPILLCMNSDKTAKICIDGKQRLSSLLKFKQNKLKWNDKYFQDLLAKEQMYFLNSSIHVIEYEDLSYDDQKEIFSRIQYGRPLSDGEKIISIFDQESATKFKKLCDDLYTEKLFRFKNIKNKRDEHYIFIVNIITILYLDGYDITKKEINNALKEDYEENEKKIKNLFEIAFSEKLLLNSKIFDVYQKIPMNRLLIIINEIRKEKLNKKSLNSKYNEVLDIIVKFCYKDKIAEKKIGDGTGKISLNRLGELYKKTKQNIDSDSDNTDTDEESTDDEIILPIKKNKV
jgi:hypothetical protein